MTFYIKQVVFDELFFTIDLSQTRLFVSQVQTFVLTENWKLVALGGLRKLFISMGL